MGILDKGIDLLRTGKNEEAADYFLKMSEVEPKNDGVLRFLGKSYALLGQKAEATTAIEKAIAINPEQPIWLYNLLLDTKIEFLPIAHAGRLLPAHVQEKLSSPKALSQALYITQEDYPQSLYHGDGLLGKQIMYRAIRDKCVKFISPYTGDIIKSKHSLGEHAYYFKTEGIILTFFSNYASPYFAYYQLYLVKESKVIYGYLDNSSSIEPASYNVSSFKEYYSSLLKRMNVNASEYEKYCESDISGVAVTNQSYKHLGHSIWNGVSSIYPIIEDSYIRSEIDALCINDKVLPDSLKSYLIDEKTKVVDDPVQYSICNNNLLITFKNNYIPEKVATNILRGAIDSSTYDLIKTINTFRQSFYPIVLLGLRCGTRSWVDQEIGIKKIMNTLSESFPNIGFIIDGMNAIDDTIDNSHGNIDLVAELEIAAKFSSAENCISTVGKSIEKSLLWCEICDLFIAPWGAGLAKYKWINNKKGIVYSSKCVLESKIDLHIYDDSSFREKAESDIWLNSYDTTNDDFSDYNEFQSIKAPSKGFYYQNYKVNEDKLIHLAVKYLSQLKSHKVEILRQNFLK